MFRHWVLLAGWHIVILNVPEVVLCSRTYRVAPHPLGASLNPLHFPTHPVSGSMVSWTSCLPSVLSPTEQTRVLDRQQWNAIPKPGWNSPLWRGLCQHDAGTFPAAISGRPTELDQRNVACNRHACLSLVGPQIEKLYQCCSFQF